MRYYIFAIYADRLVSQSDWDTNHEAISELRLLEEADPDTEFCIMVRLV